MGETGTIAKIFIALGLIFIVVGLLYPGSDSGWTGFTNAISGQTFPTFNNPFSPQRVTQVQRPTNSSMTNGIESTTGCLLTFYWECVASDQDGKFLTLNGSDNGLGAHLGGYFTLNMTPVNGSSVDAAYVTFSCRTPVNQTTPLSVAIVQPGPTFTNYTVFCPGSTFNSQRVAVQFSQSSGCGACFPMTDATWNNLSAGITMTLGPNQKVDVEYIQVEVVVEVVGTVQCSSGFDVGCQLSRFFDPVVKMITFGINGFVFFGAVIWWGLNLLYLVLIGVTTQFAFFFHLPGAPPVVQAIIGACLVGALALIFITVTKVLRGSSSG